MTSLTRGYRRSFATLFFLAACDESPALKTDLPHFNDILSAPLAIQTAARAVVRVHTASGSATGSFISPDGLLLTNNHVLGVPVCPVEGCSIQITFMHQLGTAPTAALNVFAIPIAVDEGLDVAIAGISELDSTGAPAARLATPDYLAWRSEDAASLLGMHVTIVGHPESRLKKWTDGTVFDATGTWFSSSAYILPGDSGSPALDDDGKLVGIMHHSPSSQDLITETSLDESSTGTASGPIEERMNAPLPASMVSVLAPTTAAEAVENQSIYLGAGTATVTADGTSTTVVSLLGQACDAAIASVATTVQTIDELPSTLAPCSEGPAWIECRTDETPGFLTAVGCPDPDDVGAWRNRYQQVNGIDVAANGEPNLAAVSFDIGGLSNTKADGMNAARDSLKNALAAAGTALDFNVANYLAAFQFDSYDGTEIGDYVRNYRRAPEYQLSASNIASAAGWLLNAQIFSVGDVQSILENLAMDPNVSLGAKLYIEEYRYSSGWIQ